MTGGCFWNLDPDSDGYSIRIPNGTAFKIALDDPTSSRFAEGQCRDGVFVLFEATERCSHRNANAVVHAARKSFAKASNAYLYLWFKIDDDWELAGEIRSNPRLGFPAAEERLAEELLEESPEILEFARQVLAGSAAAPSSPPTA